MGQKSVRAIGERIVGQYSTITEIKMKEYHKITTVYERNPDDKFKTLLEGRWAKPEFEFLAYNNWVYTEKVDGTNIRVMWDGEKVTFGGKTDRAQIPATLVEKLQDKFYSGALSEVFDFPVCLYGEGYGNKIQKGGGNYNPDGVDFVLFDVLVGDIWLERENVEDVANKLQIQAVPIVGKGSLFGAIEMCREGFNSEWGDFKSEGIVARPEVEIRDRRGHRIITKIKCKDFQ
jgi:hypothetical protein